MTWPLASNTVAAIRAVSWAEAKTTESGSTETEAGTRSTVTIALPDALPAWAVIVVSPSPTAVTRPL